MTSIHVPTFPDATYRTIYADPPWNERGAGRIKRGADRHYRLMKTSDIAALPVQALIHGEGAHLYLWVTNNYLPDGLTVMAAWGFRYVTTITWVKTRDGSLAHRGLGQYFPGVTEHCLFGVSKSKTPPYRTFDGLRQQGKTIIVTAERAEHSRKPAAMREMIERVSYPPKIELFARGEVEGWDAWGNGAGSG